MTTEVVALPMPTNEMFNRDVGENIVVQRASQDIGYVPRVITKRGENELLSVSKKENINDLSLRDDEKRVFTDPAGKLYRSSRQETGEMSDGNMYEKTSTTHRKRIIDIITGEECGAFGGCDNGNTNGGGFEYGYPDDDEEDYGTSQEESPLGYWTDCEDDAESQCYYYYDTDPRGYWADCVDVADQECYYYYDNWMLHDSDGTLALWCFILQASRLFV